MSDKVAGGSIQHPYFADPDKFSRLSRAQELATEQQQTHAAPQDTLMRDLKQLILLGMMEDTLTIGGFDFKIRTLSSTEQDQVWLSLSFLDNANKILLVKKPILARAIVSVNGTALASLYDKEDKDIADHVKALYVLGQWQDSLVDAIFDFYSNLVSRSKVVFAEVNENIKK